MAASLSFDFWKYHGIGNDFLLVDADQAEIEWTPALAREVCDRHRGVGADGVLLLLPSTKADFRMIIYNADGSRPEMCGNGLRCFARYVFEQEYTSSRRFSVETDRGVLSCEVLGEGAEMDRVRIEMGAPILESQDIPVVGGPGRFLEQSIECDGDSLTVSGVSMGNPHMVIFDWTPEQQERLAPLLERHPTFPQRTNVEFVTIHGPSSLEVIVYERGCGYTQACGTGACAVAVAAILTERIPGGQEVEVRLPGGPLGVEVEPDFANVWLIGPAVPVYQGRWLGDD